MQKILFPVSLNQLEDFKNLAKLFTERLSKKSGYIRLSAFKQLDMLAQVLGYKSHTDLVYSAKSKDDCLKKQTLNIFSEFKLHKKIVTVYAKNLSNMPKDQIQEAINEMANLEQIRVFDDKYYKSSIFVTKTHKSKISEFWLPFITCPLRASEITKKNQIKWCNEPFYKTYNEIRSFLTKQLTVSDLKNQTCNK